MTAEMPEDGSTLDTEFMQKISLLATSADAISKEVPELATAVRKNRATLRMVWFVVGLLIMALIGSGYALYEEHHTNDQLKANIVSVQAVVASQKATRSQVLCPLYSAFVSSFTPARRATQPPQNLAFYDHAVAAIEQAYQALGCPQPPVH